MTPYVPSFTPDAIRERKTWQFKTLSFCHDHPAEWGETATILIAVMGRLTKRPGWHPGGMRIKKNGEVFGLFRASPINRWHVVRMFESVAQLVERFRKLADEAKLEDFERLAMFDELKKWVIEDERARSEI